MKYFIFFIFAFLPPLSYSQNRKEVWSRIVVNKAIKENLTFSIDLQHRRQSYNKANENELLKYPLINSVRIWVYLKRGNDFQYFLSPFAFFTNYDFDKSGSLFYLNEYRVNGGILKRLAMGGLRNNNRLLYEVRFIEITNKAGLIQHRYRLQNNLILPLKRLRSNLLLNNIFSNELFINTSQGKTFFDQDRIYNAIQIHFNYIDVNVGYQWTIQIVKDKILNRNQFQFSFACNL